MIYQLLSRPAVCVCVCTAFIKYTVMVKRILQSATNQPQNVCESQENRRFSPRLDDNLRGDKHPLLLLSGAKSMKIQHWHLFPNEWEWQRYHKERIHGELWTAPCSHILTSPPVTINHIVHPERGANRLHIRQTNHTLINIDLTGTPSTDLNIVINVVGCWSKAEERWT